MLNSATAFNLRLTYAIAGAENPAAAEPDEVLWFHDRADAAHALRYIELGDIEKAEGLAYMVDRGREAARDYKCIISSVEHEIVGDFYAFSHRPHKVTVCAWDSCLSEEVGLFAVDYIAAACGIL